MIVFVQLRGKARRETGKGSLTVVFNGDADISDLLDKLGKQLNWGFKEKFIDPNTGDLKKKVIVLVNGLPVRGKLKSIRLKDEDKIILFPHTVCG